MIWPDHFWIMVAICLVGWFIAGAAPMNVLLGPMIAGIYMCMFAIMRGERPGFETLFKGFDVFIETLVATLIMVGVWIVVMIPMGIAMAVLIFGVVGAVQKGGGAADGAMLGLIILAYVGMIVVSVVIQSLFIFAYPLIVDHGLSGFEACKLSARAAWANIWNVIRMMILLGIIGCVSAILCFLPLLFAIPIMQGTQALLYRSVFPLEGEPVGQPADPYGDPRQDPYADSGGGAGYQLDDVWQ
tara:strand:- start:1273 stop:2001 length:729 start_codon:yes stop_codon:yes gene_type:complete